MSFEPSPAAEEYIEPPPTAEELVLYRGGATRFQILAYIERLYSPPGDDIDFENLPNAPAGYLCDATLALLYEEGGSRMTRLPIHLGDGVLYPTFEAAQKVILDECGILVEPIPEGELPTDFPRTGKVCVRVGRLIQEFAESGRSRDEIEADHVMPPMPQNWRLYTDYGAEIEKLMRPPDKRPN